MAMILDAFVGNLISRLSALLEEKVMTVLGAKQELQKLRRSIERINRVLRDAERKRIQSEVVAGWVEELKDVVYDADDIVDLCRYEGGRLLGDQPSSSSSAPWVRCSFPSLLSCFSCVRFRHEIGGRIKDLLRTPLQSGAICSRVLVTTRDPGVAAQMGAMHVHPVEELPLESGWELLYRSVYITTKAEMQSLRDVGVQIVKKCHGLPLAIKAIAGVLTRKERSKAEWEKVLRRDAWSADKLPPDVRGALYLSYEDLPSPLKQCFIYLSLFPEDSEFSRRDVVNYWAVEGFTETPKDSFVELADEYFEELILRNLIQPSSTFMTVHNKAPQTGNYR